jgi:heptosyltransferase I
MNGRVLDAQPPEEICIVMLSAIGDAVHVLPVASALKRAWPSCRITWVIQPVPYMLAEGHPAIDEFIIFQRVRGLRAWTAYRDLRRRLKGRHFDLVLGLQVYLKAGLITALIPGSVKLGFDRSRARDGQWLVTNERIPAHAPQHVQDQYFEFLHHLGVEPEPVTWGLSFSEQERAAQAAFFEELGRPACAVVLGTSKLEKNWSVDGYVRVVEELDRTHGLQPVIVGGPSKIERRMFEEVRSQTDVHLVDMLVPDLRELMWIIEGSVLLVSPDTGPLHIGRALGTPCVSLFGHTNPKRYRPYRAFEDLVVDGYAEYPGEDYPATAVYRNAMNRVTVGEVLEKIELALSRYLRG